MNVNDYEVNSNVPPVLVVERLTDTAVLPDYAHATDSGFDIYADEDIHIAPHKAEAIPTGLRFQIPAGYEVQLRPRSSRSLIGLPAQFGTIDEGYRGEIAVIMANMNSGTRFIQRGEKIAQGILTPVSRAAIIEDSVSIDTDRGVGGFGSTGS